MRKKVFGILITLALMLSLCLTASIHVMAAATLYVDDSNGGIEDGTEAHPYNTIMEAVTASSAGDTIIVAGGTYAESVTVDKSLEIRAKSGETPEITIAGVGFSITANEVTIDGFTITQATDGIYLNSASSCTITGNTLDECSNISIKLTSANTNVVLDNTCTGNTGLCTIDLDDSHGNIITNNTCIGNEHNRGINMTDSNGNTVAGNSFSILDYGIFIIDGIDNIFTANTCYMNSLDGIFLAATIADDLFSRNTFIYNTLAGNNRGMCIAHTNISSSLVYFKNNNITNNDAVGVQNDGTGILDATANYWSGNTLDQNGNVDTSSFLAAAVTNTIPVASVVTTTTTTSTTTSTTTTTEVETETITAVQTTTQTVGGMQVVTLVETSTSTTTETDTVTLLNPTTLTETQSLTSTNTLTSTATQSVTSTDTQSLTFTVTVPQTVNHTLTTTLTLTEETLDWPLIIIIAVAGLLAGGLVVAIIIRKV